MDVVEAFLLGIIQGLTEFLPISSSGHIELGKALLQINIEEAFIFSIVLHAATALSTLVFFRKEILNLLVGGLLRKDKYSFIYISKIAISMIPVGIVGIFMKDTVENLFDQQTKLVGFMLWITGLLLLFSYFFKLKKRGNITFIQAFVIGIAQAIAVLPGISRSGTTISIALMLGVDRVKATQFSFLMVLPPIFGATLLELKDFLQQEEEMYQTQIISLESLIVGFLCAFFTGLAACKWMISLVRKDKLFYFSIYCGLVGSIAIFF